VATSFPMSLPHAPTGFVNQAALDTAFTTPINDLAAQSSLGYYGDQTSAATVTLSTTSAFAGGAAVTFTLSTQRRVRIVCNARFQMTSGTSGRYQLIAACNSGTTPTIGSATLGGLAQSLVLTITSLSGSASLQQEGTILLAAGTYVAYPSLTRLSGGSTTDTVPACYVAVYDAGSV